MTTRAINAPAGYLVGALLALFGMTGFLLAGYGDSLGPLSATMSIGTVHLSAGAVLVAAAILGDRPARLANLGAGFLYLTLFVVGLWTMRPADQAMHFALALTLIAVGRTKN